MMEGYLGAWYARHVKEIDKLEQEVVSGQGPDGKALTPAQLSEARNDLSGEQQVIAEFPNFVPRLPDMTFEREMNLNLGSRPVEIKYLGRGNTPGGAVVFLPKERILISGDIVVHPVPYPSEWGHTLSRLIDLDPRTIIPGHGDVLHDLTYPRRVQKLLSDVVTEVRHSLYEQGNGKPFDDIRKQVEHEMNFDSVRREFDKANPDNFDQSSAIQNCLVRNAYYEEVLR